MINVARVAFRLRTKILSMSATICGFDTMTTLQYLRRLSRKSRAARR